jgi:hypothetical protein
MLEKLNHNPAFDGDVRIAFLYTSKLNDTIG